MKNVSVAELKADLSKILRLAAAGEEVQVTKHGRPLVRISAAETETPRKRVLGAFKGDFWMADDFDEPLEDFAEYM